MDGVQQSSEPLEVPQVPETVSAKMATFRDASVQGSHTVGTAWNALVKLVHEVYHMGKNDLQSAEAIAEKVKLGVEAALVVEKQKLEAAYQDQVALIKVQLQKEYDEKLATAQKPATT